MDQDLFFKGETITEFIESLGGVREKFEQHMAEINTINDLPGDINMAVIAEAWSGDVLYYVPVLFRIAQDAGWNVRVFRRDQYPQLIDQYRKDGLYRSIPVAVIYDHDFNEIAHWIERPEEATRVIEEESLKLRRRLREEHKTEWREAAIKEVKNLIKPL